MRKFFTLTLALVASFSLWAAVTYHSVTANIANTDYETFYLYKNSSNDANVIGKGYSSSTLSFSTANTSWVEGNCTGKDNSGDPGDFSSQGFYETAAGDLKFNGTSSVLTFHVTNCIGVAILGKGNSSTKPLQLSVKESGSSSEVGTIAQNASNTVAVTAYGTALSASKNYDITISSVSGGNSYAYQIRFTAAPSTTYTVTIDPNGGSYASTPEGWTFNEGVYTKSVGAGSFNVPEGLTYSGYDLNGWKDGQGNDITLPITLSHDTTIIAQWAAHQTSSDATLADLKVDGVTVTGFAAATVEYNVELPFGTTVVPTVTATANSAYAKSVIVTQASSVSGVASVVVTAENNSTKTYTINFSVASSKDLLLVFRTSIAACVGTPSVSDAILSNDAAVSTYINQISFDNVEGTGDNGKETGGKNGSLDVGKKAGNMFTLSVKKGYAFKEMSFKGKIQDANCEYSLDGGEWITLTSTDTSNDDCYNPFSDAEVTQFRLRSTGNLGVWIRNMQLTIINSNKTPTALDDANVNANAIKRIENGQLIIEKNGVRYNAMGQTIR